MYNIKLKRSHKGKLKWVWVRDNKGPYRDINAAIKAAKAKNKKK